MRMMRMTFYAITHEICEGSISETTVANNPTNTSNQIKAYAHYLEHNQHDIMIGSHLPVLEMVQIRGNWQLCHLKVNLFSAHLW